jgi:O-antigen ligase
MRLALITLAGRGGLAMAALVLLSGGIVYSASRAGFLAFVAGGLVMLFTLDVVQKQRWSATVQSAALLLALILGALAIAGSGIISRFALLIAEGDVDRAGLRAVSLKAIDLAPWSGWGLGSFESLYSLLQPPTLLTFYDKAHNAYLETAIELGLPITLLLLFGILWIVVRCVRGISERSRDAHYPAIALGASVLLGLHSFVNFDIQIPAIAVCYAALLGQGWRQSWSSRRVYEQLHKCSKVAKAPCHTA